MAVQSPYSPTDFAVNKAVKSIADEFESIASFSKLVRVTRELLNCGSCYVYLPESSDPYSYRCVAATPHALNDTQMRADILGGVLARWIRLDAEPLHLQTLDEIHEFICSTIEPVEYKAADGPPLHNLLLQPFTFRPNCVGVIVAGDKSTEREQAFAQTDVSILSAVANVFALVARYPTTAADATTRGDGIRDAIQEVATKLGGRITLKELLNEVLEATMNRFNSEVCAVYLTKPDNPNRIECVAGAGYAQRIVGKAEYEIGDGFTGHIAKSQVSYNIRNGADIQRLVEEGIWKNTFNDIQFAGTDIDVCHNILAVPLLAHDGVLGVIKVENKKVTRQSDGRSTPEQAYTPYTDEDLLEFETIANVVSLAIQNATLYQQVEKQLKSIAAKAAHRIHNHATNYDGLELKLMIQCNAPVVDKEQLGDVLRRLRETTQGLKRMTDEFKNYGKPLQLKKELVDINGIIRNEVWLANEVSIANAETETTIYADCCEEIPMCQLDAARFAEAIKELLRNSKKALAAQATKGKRGICRVTTSLGEIRDLDFELRGGREDAKIIRITIEDNGPGFPAGFPAFEAFYSTDPNSTGLGLATVKELFVALGGAVAATQSEMGGAKLTLVIPLRG